MACKHKNKKREEVPDAIIKMLDALSGEALRIATSIPADELLEEDLSGIEKLKERIKTFIFPVIKDEVKTLWREGQRESGGVLSRQKDEAMTNYVERRRMWYMMLVQFAPNMSLSDQMRGELLLSNAGITDVDKKIILAKPDILEETPFDKIAEALCIHHSQIHLRGRREHAESRRERSSGFGTSNRRRMQRLQVW